ncbi:hypothetical protein OS493_004697 [Desmophyllum pertusum]|uniref:G-protein coupled receptors family 1 profile domain-containing protein n=1 Tax=Desmophyllum pertusum TaxID=174260 RepID=A0A9W9ZJH6_9CNID|nr:hypothetical protein OS493_004697 [Desmophyllum pertusum]
MEQNSTSPVFQNDSNSTQQATTQISTIPLSEQVTWCIALALVAIAIIVGNILTIAVFTRKKLLRLRANYFLITLAVADLLVGTFAVPLIRFNLRTHDNRFGTVVCGDVSITTSNCLEMDLLLPHSSCVDVVTTGSCAILYERLRSIQIQNLLLFHNILHIFIVIGHLRGLCAHMGKRDVSQKEKPKRDSKYQGELEQQKRSAQEKQLVTTLLILTLVFVLTWIPFYILNIVVFFNDKWESSRIPYEVFSFTKLLHYSNSFANPIVYSIRIPRFTRTLLGTFRRTKTAFLESLHLK